MPRYAAALSFRNTSFNLFRLVRRHEISIVTENKKEKQDGAIDVPGIIQESQEKSRSLWIRRHELLILLQFMIK
jgi:hypothetical protein